MTDRVLTRAYYDPESSAFMAGSNQLYRVAKSRDSSITVRAVREWLNRQRVYTLHKPVRHRFKRQRTTAIGLHTHIQIDLADMRALKYHNSHYTFILCAIDVMSRQARALPLKTKRAADVLPALQQILQSYTGTNWTVYADKGTEFEAGVRKWLNAALIEFVQVENSPHHASMVERWIRTLKMRLYRYMTYARSKRWLPALQPVVSAYNRSYHRIIRRAPDSITHENEERVYQELYGRLSGRRRKPVFTAGDVVRIKAQKHLLQKGYTQTFREHPQFVIAEQVPGRSPPAYRLQNDKGDPVRGVWYEQELVPAGSETGPRNRLR